jgi:Flp pilus assembly secretin CpaC
MNSNVCGRRLPTTSLGYSNSGADIMYKTPAYCRSAAVVAFVFASTISATQAQKSTITETLAQQWAPIPGQEANGVMTNITVRPGFIQKVGLQKVLKSIHIGDPSVVDVMPIDSTTILVHGKKAGNTSINITGENASYFVIVVAVDPLPDSTTVEVYDSKEVHNSVSWECMANYGCGYPVVHDVKAEDLPKGYSKSLTASEWTK